MNIVENNPTVDPKKNLFTTVTLLSKIVALCLFVALPFAGFYLGIKYQKSITVIQSVETPKANEEPVNNLQPEIKKRMLMTKKIEGGQIAAYRLKDKYSDVFTDTFAISLEAGTQYTPIIFSVSSEAFMEDGLFEIVDDELWVVNSQTNKVDVYSYSTEKKVGNAIQLSSLIYKDTINLPKYRVGNIYSIKCENEYCTVLTAFHLESGCDMTLNPRTREFSDIKCAGMGGEFAPDPF